jgi:hypothetical protein
MHHSPSLFFDILVSSAAVLMSRPLAYLHFLASPKRDSSLAKLLAGVEHMPLSAFGCQGSRLANLSPLFTHCLLPILHFPSCTGN